MTANVRNIRAGRPKSSYKYTNPITEEPMSAVEYHRLIKSITNVSNKSKTHKEDRTEIVLAKIVRYVNSLLIEECELR